MLCSHRKQTTEEDRGVAEVPDSDNEDNLTEKQTEQNEKFCKANERRLSCDDIIIEDSSQDYHKSCLGQNIVGLLTESSTLQTISDSAAPSQTNCSILALNSPIINVIPDLLDCPIKLLTYPHQVTEERTLNEKMTDALQLNKTTQNSDNLCNSSYRSTGSIGQEKSLSTSKSTTLHYLPLCTTIVSSDSFDSSCYLGIDCAYSN
ncbi:unnamed protein product [Protopolystoma xenopodis]|uniref:Uncharacterized protein n=1 Tax=Protopolystoma xenopodis TaxID=117903 RepID=A0A448WFI1_9PLAT|nr:unnamed protein product [Protopolystoma xenopodis]